MTSQSLRGTRSGSNSCSSTACADAGRPGFAEVSAAIAASFASVLSRTIRLTSTPDLRVASRPARSPARRLSRRSPTSPRRELPTGSARAVFHHHDLLANTPTTSRAWRVIDRDLYREVRRNGGWRIGGSVRLELAVGCWVGRAAARGRVRVRKRPPGRGVEEGAPGWGRGYRTRNLRFLAFPRVLVLRPGLITSVYLCL